MEEINNQTSLNPFKVLDDYVLRTPILNYEFAEELLIGKPHDETILKHLEDPVVSNGVFIASKIFWNRAVTSYNEGGKKSSTFHKINRTLYKYLIRMSTRCTPFGLFAGCCVGKFSNCTDIVLKRKDCHRLLMRPRHVGIWAKKPLESPRFDLNQSMYQMDKNWRYIERHEQNNQFVYTTEQINDNDTLRELMQFAKGGKTKKQLLRFLDLMGLDEADSTRYVTELIVYQVLKPSLGYALTNSNKSEVVKLNPTKRLNSGIDQNTYHFDLFIEPAKNTLKSSIKTKIIEVMNLLHRLSPFEEHRRLSNFKKEFQKRYGDKSMPLGHLLDVDHGISYLGNNSIVGDSPLIEALNLKHTDEEHHFEIKLNKAQIILNEKVQEAQRDNKNVIHIVEDDFKDISLDWDQCDSSMYSIMELYSQADRDTMVLTAFHGGTAAKLIARFGYGNERIQGIIDEVISFEKKSVGEEIIIAEINHLASYSTENILRRTVDRDYELTYYGVSGKPLEKQIRINDLMVSVVNGETQLFSKILGKRVVPRLTNAHNYLNSPLPLYQFLCDLSSDMKKPSIALNWGNLQSLYRFLPRVVYKDVILKKAQWTCKRNELPRLVGDDMFPIIKWRKKNGIPALVMLIEGDKKLLLNLEAKICYEILLHTTSKSKWFQLEEFLAEGKTPVKDIDCKHYMNEFIVFLTKSK